MACNDADNKTRVWLAILTALGIGSISSAAITQWGLWHQANVANERVKKFIKINNGLQHLNEKLVSSNTIDINKNLIRQLVEKDASLPLRDRILALAPYGLHPGKCVEHAYYQADTLHRVIGKQGESGNQCEKFKSTPEQWVTCASQPLSMTVKSFRRDCIPIR